MLPEQFILYENDGKQQQKELLVDDKTDYFVMNYSAVDLCKENLGDYGENSILMRTNIVSHPWIYPKAKPNDEKK